MLGFGVQLCKLIIRVASDARKQQSSFDVVSGIGGRLPQIYLLCCKHWGDGGCYKVVCSTLLLVVRNSYFWIYNMYVGTMASIYKLFLYYCTGRLVFSQQKPKINFINCHLDIKLHNVYRCIFYLC